MIRARLALALLVAVALASGGCGGSDEDQAREVAADFYDALADRDGERACALTVDDGAALNVEGVLTCEEALGDAGVGGVPPEVKGVNLRGEDRATVGFEGGSEVTLVKTDGDWHVEDF